MGSVLAKIISADRKPLRIALFGQYGAGKSTLLAWLAGGAGEVATSSDLLSGLVFESIATPTLDVVAWDTGGQSNVVKVLTRSLADSHKDAFVLVVDANDRDQLRDAKEELESALTVQAFAHVPLLVFANKQDLPNALNSAAVADVLALSAMRRVWFVQESNFLTGENVEAGLSWLRRNCS